MMKKMILALLFVATTVLGVSAQITQGAVTYTAKVKADAPELAMAVQMMDGTTMDVYFDGDWTRMNMDMGAMMQMSSIVDGDSGKMLMLMGGMMGKKAIPTSTKELKAAEEKQGAADFDVKLLDDTKEILGYTCKKAVSTDKVTKASVIYWYTEDIKVNTDGQQSFNTEIPGFSLEFTSNMNGMEMTYTATTIETKLSKEKRQELFSLDIPEGYSTMTLEQLQMLGGM